MRAIANFCLILGLTLWVCCRESTLINRGWLLALCGVFLGISIGLNLLWPRLARRCGTSESGKP
jgi:hypothetical protein